MLTVVRRTRQAQETRRIERVSENLRDTDEAGVLLFGPNRHNRPCEVGCLPDVERWMSVEDLQAAEQQQSHADDPHPMGQSDHGRVAIYDRGRSRVVGHGCSQLSSLGSHGPNTAVPAPGDCWSTRSRICDTPVLFIEAARQCRPLGSIGLKRAPAPLLPARTSTPKDCVRLLSRSKIKTVLANLTQVSRKTIGMGGGTRNPWPSDGIDPGLSRIMLPAVNQF